MIAPVQDNINKCHFNLNIDSRSQKLGNMIVKTFADLRMSDIVEAIDVTIYRIPVRVHLELTYILSYVHT